MAAADEPARRCEGHLSAVLDELHDPIELLPRVGDRSVRTRNLDSAAPMGHMSVSERRDNAQGEGSPIIRIWFLGIALSTSHLCGVDSLKRQAGSLESRSDVRNLVDHVVNRGDALVLRRGSRVRRLENEAPLA